MANMVNALTRFPKYLWQSVVGRVVRVVRGVGGKRGSELEWGVTRTTTLTSTLDGWGTSDWTSRGILACGNLYDVLGRDASLGQAQRFVEEAARRFGGPELRIEWATSPNGASSVGNYVRSRFARWRRHVKGEGAPDTSSFDREKDAWRPYTGELWHEVEMRPGCAALISIDESFIKVQDVDEEGQAQVRTCWKGADSDRGYLALRNIIGLWQLFPGPDGSVLLRFETESDFMQFSTMIQQHDWFTYDTT